MESLKIFGRRTRDIAVTGLADNIWKNQKLVDGAAVIKETLGKGMDISEGLRVGAQTGLWEGTILPLEKLIRGDRPLKPLFGDALETADFVPKSRSELIGQAITNPSKYLTPELKRSGVPGPVALGLGLAADIAAPGFGGEVETAEDVAKLGAKIKGGKVVSSLVDDWDDLVKFFRGMKGKSIDDIVAERPDIMLKVDVPAKNVHGEKVTVPEGEILTPYELKDGKVLLQDGKTYLVSKNQFENIKGNAEVGEQVEFAPELKETTETIRETVEPKNRHALENELEKLKEKERELAVDEASRPGGGMESVDPDSRDYIRTVNRRREVENILAGGPSAPKFSDQVLPGGSNYREILIRAPGEDLDELAQEMYQVPYDDLSATERATVNTAMPKGGVQEGHFQGGHFTEWDILAHLRMNEHTVNGSRVAFMEEAQSDWMRAFRSAEGKGEPIKGHPLLERWTEMAAQRALKEAAASKAKYLAWTTGEQQVARYGLSKKINGINWEKGGENKVVWMEHKDGNATSFDVNDKGVIVLAGGGVPEEWVGKNVEDAIGADLAKEVMKSDEGSLVGDQLNVGGEWARNLYDKQFKNIIEDLTGGKVKMIDMGLPVGQGEAIFTYKTASGNYKPLTKDKLKPGLQVSAQSTTDPSSADYIVTEVLEGGKFKGIKEDDLFYVQSAADHTDATKVVTIDGEHYAYDPDWQEVFNLEKEASPGQPAIELTDKVLAKIRGESPVPKKKKKK